MAVLKASGQSRPHKWLALLTAAAVVCCAVAVTLAAPSTAGAQQYDTEFLRNPPPCGGWGTAQAVANVAENNKDLYPVKESFGIREQPGGRWQTWKEECARMDLERDLYSFWRVMALAAGSVFLIAAAYAGISYMTEGLTRGQNPQARTIAVNATFGLLVVAFGFLIWQGLLIEVIGLNTIEIGRFNPFGVAGT